MVVGSDGLRVLNRVRLGDFADGDREGPAT